MFRSGGGYINVYEWGWIYRCIGVGVDIYMFRSGGGYIDV